jgi:hypothetical protein
LLEKIAGNNIQVICNRCGKRITEKLTEKEPLKFLEEFDELENFSVVCNHCGLIEIFNMNLPETDENDENIPEDEKEHRKKVKELAKAARKEDKDQGKEAEQT